LKKQLRKGSQRNPKPARRAETKSRNREKNSKPWNMNDAVRTGRGTKKKRITISARKKKSSGGGKGGMRAQEGWRKKITANFFGDEQGSEIEKKTNS